MSHQGVGSFTGDFVARHNKTYTLSLFYTEEVTSPSEGSLSRPLYSRGIIDIRLLREKATARGLVRGNQVEFGHPAEATGRRSTEFIL
jgi:hypothetical protein